MTTRKIPGPLAVLVGAGPGDDGLLTRAGAEWLARADAIIYDRLINPSLLRLARPDAELVYVGKTPGSDEMTQERINALLVEQCSRHSLVVRLKGGDPFIFGRGGEEADALRQAGIAFRVVPGVTAGIAAGAYAGIPLTDRRAASSVAFVTGHEDPAKEASAINWQALAGIDTLVFYMGVANVSAIAERLMAAGRAGETPAAIVARASTPTQQTVTATLATLAAKADEAAVKAPAVIIVGHVVRLRERLSWLEQLPLFGRTILVTRARHQASRLSARLAELGANVIEAPTLDILPPEDWQPVDRALAALRDVDWLALTSANGVEALFARMQALGYDARRLGGLQIAAVGPGTAAALRERQIVADLVPATFTTDALGEAMWRAVDLRGKKVLLARAEIASAELARSLSQAGAVVQEVTLYRTRRPAALPREASDALAGGRVDWITFASSSTVENFLAMAAGPDGRSPDLSGVKLAAIGPVTARTMEARGLAPTVVANPHTIDALAQSILDFELESRAGSIQPGI